MVRPKPFQRAVLASVLCSGSLRNAGSLLWPCSAASCAAACATRGRARRSRRLLWRLVFRQVLGLLAEFRAARSRPLLLSRPMRPIGPASNAGFAVRVRTSASAWPAWSARQRARTRPHAHCRLRGHDIGSLLWPSAGETKPVPPAAARGGAGGSGSG